MKQEIERRKPEGFVDYLSLAITTVGVGYIPGAPGTYGSAVGVALYLLAVQGFQLISDFNPQHGGGGRFWAISMSVNAAICVGFAALCLSGIWASGRSITLLGNSDPSQAVIDEVMGQLIVFFFVPAPVAWPVVLAGFLLFRLFDIWKPYPIRTLEILPGGLGICADDIVAGVYAGICLAVGHAVYLSI